MKKTKRNAIYLTGYPLTRKETNTDAVIFLHSSINKLNICIAYLFII